MKFRIFISIVLSLMACAKGPIQPGLKNDAVIYEPSGERPSAGAIVKFFEIGDTSFIPCKVCTTDAKGRYSVKGLSTGEYDLWAEKDSFVLFQSAVTISSNYTRLHDDSLKPASSISGVITVQFPHDPRTVTIHVVGTDKGCAITNEDGTFTVSGMAAGTWSLLLTSSLPGYMPYLKNVLIAQGMHVALTDTLKLYSTDLPFVSGVRISQDTMAGAIRLSWDPTSYKNCLDYVVYRALCSDVEFSKYPLYATKDTFLVDTILKSHSLPKPGGNDSIRQILAKGAEYANNPDLDKDSLHSTDSLDTISQCFRYRIAVRTWNQEIGPTKGFAEQRFAPQSFVTTYFSHNVDYPMPKLACLGMNGKASLHDTVALSIYARNITRQLRSVSWHDPLTQSTVATKVLPGTGRKELRDTVRYAFNSFDYPISPCLIADVMDVGGSRWYDTVFVTIVDDTPYVDAGYDTGVFIGTPIHLHGAAVDYYNSIAGWEWKIGDDAWIRTNSPDTSFTAPLIEETLVCSLAAVNADGNRAAADVHVFTSRKIQGIAANSSHTLMLKDDGSLWSSGGNYYGQLGDGSRTDRADAVKIMDGVKKMCAGLVHSLILKTDGTLWGCGDNTCGQLGDSLLVPHPFPVLMMTDVANMAAGSSHTFILKTDKTLWACGADSSGQLGDGSMRNKYAPVRILSDIQDVAAGDEHSVFLKTDGTVWTSGNNDNGQLGIDSMLVRHSLVPQLIANNGQSVYAGLHYTMVLKNDNTLWSCGYNRWGQLGDTTMEDRYSLVKMNSDVRSVVAGAGFSMTIKNNGELWVSGWNYYGNWGWEDRYKPSMVTTDVKSAAAALYYGLVLKNDGSVWTYGISENGAERIIPFMEPGTDQGND